MVFFSRHDYRFTYREIGNHFVPISAALAYATMAFNIYCNIYHQLQVATLLPPLPTYLQFNSYLSSTTRWKKHAPWNRHIAFQLPLPANQYLLLRPRKSGMVYNSMLFLEKRVSLYFRKSNKLVDKNFNILSEGNVFIFLLFKV